MVLLPSGVPLQELCEGSDGEEWMASVDNTASTLPGPSAAAAEESTLSQSAPFAPPALTPRPDADDEGGVGGAGSSHEGRLLFSCDCDMVTPAHAVAGKLRLYSSRLAFLPDIATAEVQIAAERAAWSGRGEPPQGKQPRDREWRLSSLREVHRRRYLLRSCALELFFRDSRAVGDENAAVFLHLHKKARRRKLVSKLRGACPGIQYVSHSDGQRVSELTKRWQHRLISNFEYIQQLNTLAGRTYNDLNQYPVFPWVLCDYTSEELDLSNAASFRDLSKPMGAQKPDCAAQVAERYEVSLSMQQQTGDRPFHYGSHYSSAGVVMYFLIRLEPFSTLAIQLHDGVFDHADRLFHSVDTTYANATSSTADVKELIPELFCLPEALLNPNRLELGRRQDGTALGDIVLPPWAKGSAHEFVRLHRLALESEHVSAHLGEWVDLVFGYKQRGPPAEAALNVFHHLTYEGAIDLDAIADAQLRASYQAQIQHYGNTPSQLMRQQHPRRLSLERPPLTVPSVPADAQLLTSRAVRGVPLAAVGVRSGRLVVAAADQHAASTRWLAHSASLDANHEASSSVQLPEEATWLHYGAPAAIGLSDRRANARTCISADGTMLFSCGYWDSSFKCTSLESGRGIVSLRAHVDVVTVVSLSEDGTTLVTGSRDTTLMVWPVSAAAASHGRPPLADKPRLILHGHDDEVTAVSVSSELDTIASGSRDGSVILYALRSGTYIRTIDHPSRACVDLVAISAYGCIALASHADDLIHVCSINHPRGMPPLASAAAGETLHALLFSAAGDVLLTAGGSRGIVLRQPHDLAVVCSLAVESTEPLCCAALSADEQHLLAGTEHGRLLVWGLTREARARNYLSELDQTQGLGF